MLKNNIDSILNELRENEIIEIDVSRFKLKHSEFSQIEPMMNESDYSMLENDIGLRGCLNLPVIIVNNMILDGRNRQKACIKLEIPMKVLYLKGSYTKDVLFEYVRSIHMNRNKKQSQLQIQAYRYKKTTIGVQWEDAAKKFGVNTLAIKRINSLYNELAKHGLEQDFEKIEHAMFMGLTLLPSTFEWLSKSTGSAFSAIKQLREYMDVESNKPEHSNIDTTEFDPVTGEALVKDKNMYMEERLSYSDLAALVVKLETKLLKLQNQQKQ